MGIDGRAVWATLASTDRWTGAPVTKNAARAGAFSGPRDRVEAPPETGDSARASQTIGLETGSSGIGIGIAIVAPGLGSLTDKPVIEHDGLPGTTPTARLGRELSTEIM